MEIAVAKYPRRRHHIWPWILIFSFLLFIAAPIVVTYVLVYDGATKETHIQENFDIQNLANNAIVDCLDHTTDDGNQRLNVTITGDDMDNILEMAFAQANLRNEYLKKLYCVIKENKYTFYLDAQAYGLIKSRAKIVTELDEDDTTFYFRIVDLGVGKINGILGLAKPLIKKYLPKEMVDGIFASTGLSLKYDEENLRLCYDKADVMKDLENMMGGGSGDNMFFDIIKVLMDNDLASFNTKSNNFLELDIDLKPLHSNELVTDDEQHLKVPSDQVTTRCKDKLVNLINRGIVNPSVDNLEVLFGFLFSGYQSLSDENQTYVQGIDFSSVGIGDVTTYRGFDLNDDNDYLSHVLESKIMTLLDLLKGQMEASLITESNLNTYIEGRNIIGFTTLLHRQAEESYKLNYITIDNFYSNLYSTDDDQIAEFVLKLNLNGYPTAITFESNVTTESATGSKLKFMIKEDGIRFGQINASALNDTFFTIMGSALNASDGTVTSNIEERSITINLDSFIQKAKNTLDSEFDNLFAAVPATFPTIKPGGNIMNPLDWTGTMTKVEAKEKVMQYIDELLASDNMEIKILGNTRDIDGEITMYFKENNPPEFIQALLQYIPTT